MTTRLADIVGSKTISQHIRDFDFSKFPIKQDHNEFLKVFAPSYGPNHETLEHSVIAGLDDADKLMVLVMLQTLTEVGLENCDWETLVPKLNKSTLVSPRGEPIQNSKSMTITPSRHATKQRSTSANHNYSSHDEARSSISGKATSKPGAKSISQTEVNSLICSIIMEFFNDLVGNDSDILDSTGIGPTTYTQLASLLSDTVNGKSHRRSFRLNASDTSFRCQLLNATVLKFPQRRQASVKIYRIRLDVACNLSASAIPGAKRKIEIALNGEYDLYNYQPVLETISETSEHTRPLKIQRLEELVLASAVPGSLSPDSPAVGSVAESNQASAVQGPVNGNSYVTITCPHCRMPGSYTLITLTNTRDGELGNPTSGIGELEAV